MYITQKHLSRRTVLRGMGVTMALPLLDAMVPAGAPGQRRCRRGRRGWSASRSRMAPRGARPSA